MRWTLSAPLSLGSAIDRTSASRFRPVHRGQPSDADALPNLVASASVGTAVAIVLNYNYGEFLGECLNSISAQTCEDLRAIIIDDASTDGSREIISAWQRSTPVANEAVLKDSNRGPAHSYNLALQALDAADEYVGFIDADDLWRPNRFSTQIAAFEAQSDECVVVYSDAERFDNVTGERKPKPAIPLTGTESPIVRLLSQYSFFGVNTGLIKATALRSIEPLDESMRLCDYQVWLQLARVGTFCYHPGIVADIRTHQNSMSRSEDLVGDRLRLLGRTPKSARERKAARVRGRQLLNRSLAGSALPSTRDLLEYGAGARDWRGRGGRLGSRHTRHSLARGANATGSQCPN